MVSLARFKNKKNILLYFEKCHSFLEKKSFETGWGVLAYQLLKTVCLLRPKNYSIQLLDV
jgi:hypothetical protein